MVQYIPLLNASAAGNGFPYLFHKMQRVGFPVAYSDIIIMQLLITPLLHVPFNFPERTGILSSYELTLLIIRAGVQEKKITIQIAVA